MLEIVISDKKKVVTLPYKQPTFVAPTNTPPANNTPQNDIFIEAKRRDQVIRDLIKDMPYKRGDWCVPKSDKGKQEYGRCQVTHVAENYASLGKDYEWDSSDNPLIVTARTEKGGIFFCSVNYLEKENAHAA